MNNAIFIVTGESSCPYYDVGDELKVESSSLSISSFKPVCLILSGKITSIVTEPENLSRFPKLGSQQLRSQNQQAQFDCGGCTGSIQFKYKQEKDYTTLQMKLLKESEEKRKRQHLAKYYNQMRQLDIFDSLEDNSLQDLVTFFEFKTILPQKVLVEKDAPGTHLYIIISGQVDVINDSRQKILTMNSGEMFGEVSLLSGEPHSNSIQTGSATQVALLSIKNFRQIIKKHPPLQLFLFKMLIDRVQAMALRSGDISPGMTGELKEVPAVDLMQLINSSQKTGKIELTCEKGKAEVYFKEGEIVHAHCGPLKGKEAVFTILGFTRGQFTYHRGLPNNLQQLPPIGGFIGMMMEGVQRLDEKGEKAGGE